MKIKDAYIFHIEKIERITSNSDLSENVRKLIEESKDLSDEELLKKIKSEYGQQISFLEEATKVNRICSMESWINFFGFMSVLFIIVIAIAIIILISK